MQTRLFAMLHISVRKNDYYYLNIIYIYGTLPKVYLLESIKKMNITYRKYNLLHVYIYNNVRGCKYNKYS